MMRRIPYTLLVCLVFLITTAFMVPAWASPGEESAEKILAKSQVASQGVAGEPKPKAITKVKPQPKYPTYEYLCPRPDITKVKPGYMRSYGTEVQFPEGILATARAGRWDVGGGVLFARLRGKVAWPRYAWAGAYVAGGTNETDFTDGLALPGHIAVPTWSVKYAFRPNWSVRYSGLGYEANGGGQSSSTITFGPWQQFYGAGQSVQSKYQHLYQRVGLQYDAVKSSRSCIGIFADWVHAEDKIQVISSLSVGQSAVFSKGTDAAIAGIEYRRFVKASANGGALSCECKAGAIFLDDVVGVDAQAGAQYAIPMNSGRSGYVKAGYRLVELKKAQNDYLLNNALEGGYMELGFIF
jgi:hypothetical protein